MDWDNLRVIRCPKCNAYLRYKQRNDLWVCMKCPFSINAKKREDIVGKGYHCRKLSIPKKHLEDAMRINEEDN